ncbi:hypothetical protein J1N35_040190 [Gossypium stocksii]|uniref:PPM-type phosphatase domain-containing protein n=1 Tax=Gossypium stocksii TaxID=47602 RepID=A0A9D3UD66_9ROSI|nr:hypothetical protein J1N35_040190 [Gossypium stocksii]
MLSRINPSFSVSSLFLINNSKSLLQPNTHRPPPSSLTTPATINPSSFTNHYCCFLTDNPKVTPPMVDFLSFNYLVHSLSIESYFPISFLEGLVLPYMISRCLMDMAGSMLLTLLAIICPAFAEACALDSALASGATALAALVLGRMLAVANVGDCRAILCRHGKAIEMSRDHKPNCNRERKHIEVLGGSVYDGYLNGQLNVARALGDWHIEGMKDASRGLLSAKPELMTTDLTEEDEFLIIGCDRLWDVFHSQNAVDFARRRLQEHNDPAMCSKDWWMKL